MNMKYNEDDENGVLTDRSRYIYTLLFPPPTHFPNIRSVQMNNGLCKVHNKSHDGL
jgi:hypothetical protein